MRRAVILGLGGTGQGVIKRLTDLIDWRRNEHISQLPFIQYFEMDADRPSAAERDVNFYSLEVSKAAVDKFKDEHLQQGLHKWVDIDALETASDGGSRTRTKGKFIFMYHYNAIREAVETRMKNMMMAQNDKLSPVSKKKIYIVANAVSGTGSGSFVDCGYLMREIIKAEPTYRGDAKLNITLILTIPAMLNDGMKLRNAYHALEELNHYMSGGSYTFEHVQNPGQVMECNDKPFDFVYLIGPQRGKTTDSRQLEELIGEYIYNDIFSPSADTRDAARDNMNTYLRQADKARYSQSYMTFGFSTIEYPAAQIARAAAYRLAKNTLDLFLPEDDNTAIEYKYDEIYLREGDHRQSGTIYNRLLSDVTGSVINGEEYTINLVTQIDRLKDDEYASFKAYFDTAVLRDLPDKIDMGFMAEPAMTVSGYGQGTVTKAIRRNAEILRGETDDGWDHIIKNSLCDVVFTRQGGLLTARRLLDTVIEQVKNISNAPETSGNGADMREQLRDIVGQIDLIKGDFLLKPGGLHRMPINILFDRYKTILGEYQSARLQAATAGEARRLARHALQRLEDLRNQLEKFADSVVSWRRKLNTLYDESTRPKALNGHVIRRGQIPRLADELIQHVGLAYSRFMDLCRAAFNEWLFDASALTPFPVDQCKDIEDKIRKLYTEPLNRRNVVEQFMDEERERAYAPDADPSEVVNLGKVTAQNVNAMADLFISMTINDALAINNPELTEPRWYFYPDGDNHQNGQSGNAFTKILQGLNIVTEWAEQVHESSDNFSILFLREKGCFALRYLDFASDPMTAAALRNTNNVDAINNKEVPNTYLGRIDVTFLPLQRISSDKWDELALLYLVSIISGTFNITDTSYIYEEVSDMSSVFYNTQAPIELPRVFRIAINKMQRTAELDRLKRANDSYRSARSADFVRKLHDFILNPALYGLLLDNQEDDERTIKRLLINEYVRKVPELARNWERLFPEDPLKTSDNLDYEFHVQDDRWPNTGFYCPKCLAFLGTGQHPDGTPDYAKGALLMKNHPKCYR
ncbi:MAG: tubulin-like doman-containing protein [Clostridiales bacterium]|jgi:hypothetical protein|nr:tubulin-like doman-containing protein [Clostridiales bacterium]